jgi:hypothetical protein
MPFTGLGHTAVSGGGKPVAHQRAGLAVHADQRRRAAGLIQQVTDLTEIVHTLLAQQRVHVRRQAGPAEFTVLYLAPGDQDPGRMVNEAGYPVVPPGERDEAVRDQEGDQRYRAGGERRRRSGHGPADDCADRDRDREVERAELAIVRRSPSRRPTMVTANISAALTATQPRPPVPPTSSSNHFTPSGSPAAPHALVTAIR